MRFRQLILLFSFLCVSGPIAAQQPEPVMDLATLLTAFDVRPDGRLRLENDNAPLTAVFLPSTANVQAVITKAGSQTPLHKQDFYKTQANKVFSYLESRGKYKEFKFNEPGDYELKFVSGQNVLTALPFTLVRKSNNDEFDPKTIWYTKGAWGDLAYIHYLRGAGEDAEVEFRMWGQRPQMDSTGTNTDQYDVVLKKDGDIIAEAKTGHVGTGYWLKLHFQLRNPASKGGRVFTLKHLTAQEGDYQFVVSKNKQLHAVFPLTVTGNKPKLHPRQASDFQPRSQYIIPRYWNMHAGINDLGDTVWMNRLDSANAAAAAISGPAKVAGPTPEQLDRWHWLPMTIDPNRNFEFQTTSIETRTDTGFAVGEDLVVFGVGHPNGVKYLKTGDEKARDIPEGETWSANVFGVCGHKIILTKKNQVAIFDTNSGTIQKIPADQISLYSPSNRLLNCNGFLVATVNNATDVADRTIIKVIDVSQDKPTIIPIKNSNYTHDQVTSVSVDAKNGNIAVASSAKKQIAAAKIAKLANQHVFDISEYRGLGNFQITLEDEVVTYADADWNVRQLKLGDTPMAITQEPIGRSGNGFWVRKGRLVNVTKTEKVGSRYPMMITDSNSPQLVPGTGDPIEGTSAALGLGGSAAIAIDKSVFIAGTPGESIGKGERLQLLTENGWMPIPGKDGKPVWGSQVVTSMGFMALKVRNDAGKTVVGYATYGQQISLPNGTVETTTSHPATKRIGKIEFADDNPFSTNDEKYAEKLKVYLESEAQVAEAYIPVFGKEEGSKKVVEGTLKSLKSSGNENLIDEYLRTSPHVSEEDRPTHKSKSTTKSALVDSNVVTEYLSGQWQAIRFSANGSDLPDSAIENLQLTFGNNKFVMNMGREIQTGTFSIDSSTAPMSMTINIESGKYKGQKRRGSFKLLKDDQLLITFSTNETDHPRLFVPDESGKTILGAYQKR